MSNKSLLDAAYEVISKQDEGITFQDLWVKANEVVEKDPEDKEHRIGKFYTQLLADGRFVNLGDNTWDLRSKYTFDKVHIDMSECYTDDEDDANEVDPEEDNEKDTDDEDKEDDDESEYEPDSDSQEDL